MNLSIPPDTRYGIWLRAPSSSGGKDWLGFLTNQEVISHWGKTGQVNQSKTISDRASVLDLDRKVREKRAKGYQVLGEYNPNRGWSHLPSSASPAPKKVAAALTVPPSVTDKVVNWLSSSDGREWF